MERKNKQMGEEYLEKKAFCGSNEWIQLTHHIKQRDGFTCAVCGEQSEGTRGLEIHHVIDFSHEEYRMDPDNLITVHKKCHHWIHSAKNVEKKFIKVL